MSRVRLSLVITALVAVVAIGWTMPHVQAQRGDNAGAIGITIYAEPNFRGTNANFRSEMSDLRKVGMNDRVESIRIPRGEIWEVCENINFGGRCQVFSGDEADLNRVNWGGLISSLRPVRADDPRARGGERGRGPFGPPRPRLIIFSDPDFHGESVAIEDIAAPALRLPAMRLGSVRVYGGVWQICSENDFWGRCEMVDGAIRDLGRIGFPGRIASARLRR